MANEGEERLVTLYADIHYWFGQPSARPASHRFDKGCYVYLYRNSTTDRGRLEVANHAGTPEQDAFEGFLDDSKICHSNRQPNLVTIEVDGAKGEGHGATQSTDWRLPSTDPRDEGKYLFRLHTLDIYFWTKEDADMFVQSCLHTLRSQQLQVDYPLAEQHDELASPIVQKLENMAVSDPAYNENRRSNSASTASATRSVAKEEKNNSANYTPLAYNPATPAPPEKRVHREKTPPPPEEPGVGLAHAASDHQNAQHQGSFSGSSHNLSNSQPYTGIPTSTQHSYSPAPSSQGYTSPPPSLSTAPTPNSYGAPPKDSRSHLAEHGPLDSPTTQIIGNNYLTSTTVPLQHLQPQYADYLAQHQSTHTYQPGNYYPTGTGDHDIHAQVYRPEDDESGKPGKPGKAGPGAAGPGRWEQKAEKAEKGINRLLRKVEKKMG